MWPGSILGLGRLCVNLHFFILLGSIASNLKDLIQICLEVAAQDPSRTLKILYAILKDPSLHFIKWQKTSFLKDM